MTVPAGLGAIALLLGAGAGPLLGRASWCRLPPRVAALAWLGALTGTLAALCGVVALVLTGRRGLLHRAAEWPADCWHHHEGIAGPAAYGLNLALLAITVTVTGVAARRYRRTVLQRRRHQEALRFVVRLPGDMEDVCVVDHPVPVAYCFPARKRPIVVSSGTLDTLEDIQLQAVLAHERAHLRYRHHLFLAAVDALAAALFWLPTFRDARRRLPALLEMTADDVAARRCGRQAVAMALRKLVLTSPAGGLGMGAGAAEMARRIVRLEDAAVPERDGRRATWITATAAVALPIAISAGWLSSIPVLC